MLPLLASLKGLTKLQTFTIDNQVFRLHYKVTVLVLALFSLVISYTQFFGDPIACTQTNSHDAPDDVVELFCWSHYTFSSKAAFDRPHDDSGVFYPGIDKVRPGDEIVQHKYYQWVCFVLALQAILFYLPRYLWKALEGERVKNLVLGLNVAALETEEVRKKQELLLKYLKTHRGLHVKYTVLYAVCEILNLLNVVGQMYLLDSFLGGEFTRFGIRVLQFVNEDPRERVDPMIKIFPRLTMCRFVSSGPNREDIPHNVLCILPLNIINEKIFIFLWFWFVFLLTVSSIALIYRLVMFLVPAARTWALKLRCPMANVGDVDKIISGSNIGDWFILYQLSKNIDSQHMAEIMQLHSEHCDRDQKSWSPLMSEGPYCIKEDSV